jgi:hypothetical protein
MPVPGLLEFGEGCFERKADLKTILFSEKLNVRFAAVADIAEKVNSAAT